MVCAAQKCEIVVAPLHQHAQKRNNLSHTEEMTLHNVGKRALQCGTMIAFTILSVAYVVSVFAILMKTFFVSWEEQHIKYWMALVASHGIALVIYIDVERN